jgi:hypothetical protein
MNYVQQDEDVYKQRSPGFFNEQVYMPIKQDLNAQAYPQNQQSLTGQGEMQLTSE